MIVDVSVNQEHNVGSKVKYFWSGELEHDSLQKVANRIYSPLACFTPSEIHFKKRRLAAVTKVLKFMLEFGDGGKMILKKDGVVKEKDKSAHGEQCLLGYIKDLESIYPERFKGDVKLGCGIDISDHLHFDFEFSEISEYQNVWYEFINDLRSDINNTSYALYSDLLRILRSAYIPKKGGDNDMYSRCTDKYIVTLEALNVTVDSHENMKSLYVSGPERFMSVMENLLNGSFNYSIFQAFVYDKHSGSKVSESFKRLVFFSKDEHKFYSQRRDFIYDAIKNYKRSNS